jgi:hypothetical protein
MTSGIGEAIPVYEVLSIRKNILIVLFVHSTREIRNSPIGKDLQSKQLSDK